MTVDPCTLEIVLLTYLLTCVPDECLILLCLDLVSLVVDQEIGWEERLYFVSNGM